MCALRHTLVKSKKKNIYLLLHIIIIIIIGELNKLGIYIQWDTDLWVNIKLVVTWNSTPVLTSIEIFLIFDQNKTATGTVLSPLLKTLILSHASLSLTTLSFLSTKLSPPLLWVNSLSFYSILFYFIFYLNLSVSLSLSISLFVEGSPFSFFSSLPSNFQSVQSTTPLVTFIFNYSSNC